LPLKLRETIGGTAELDGDPPAPRKRSSGSTRGSILTCMPKNTAPRSTSTTTGCGCGTVIVPPAFTSMLTFGTLMFGGFRSTV